MADIELEANGLEIELEQGEAAEIEVEVESEEQDQIQFLINNIDSANIANDIDEDILMMLGSQVVEDFNRDDDSMSDWADAVEFGQDLAKQERQGKSTPWDGASNFKSPAILEAAVAFGDRATTELLRGDLVKSNVIGKDKDQAKKMSAERTSEYMNWQLQHDMPDWVEKQEGLLYELPATGVVFKKVFFDTLTGKNRSEVIQYPNFVVNQATKSMEDAEAFTHILDVSANQMLERIRAGIWLDVNIYGEDAEAGEGSNEEEEVEQAFDNGQRFLEQNCWFDLDGDGYAEPYCVTVHEQKRKVVRIVARYDETGIFVSDQPGVVRQFSKGEITDELSLVRIEAIQDIIKYGFIRDIEGGFLDLGYYHILGSLVRTVNSTTNQLSDAGTLANLQGGFLAKGIRKKMGNMRMTPGQWASTDINAADLQTGVLPHQFKEPSTVLLQLNEMNKKEIDDLTVNMDLKGVIAPNAPATTTLALIQEAMLPASARLQSIIRSETKEFKALFKLNSLFTDPVQYKNVVDDPEADFEADFDVSTQNMKPTANPEMSSRMQRINQAEALMEPTRFQLLQMSGADIRPVIDNWLESIGLDSLVGELYPTEEEQSEEQKARIQEQQAKAQQEQKLLAIQVDQAERSLTIQEDEAESKVILNNAKALQSLADINESKARAIKLLEEAESENLNNQIATYTAEISMLDRAGDALKKQLEEAGLINGTRQVSGSTPIGAGGTGDNRGARQELALAPGNQIA